MIDTASLQQKIWEHLREGVLSRHSGFHVIALSYLNGAYPRSAYVVLRRVDQQQRKINFHTDIRQNKVEAIRDNPHICHLFYDKTKKIQIIAQGKATIHHQDDISQAAWDNMQRISKTCYAQDLHPGSSHPSATNGFTDTAWEQRSDIKILENGYTNFCVISMQAIELEWLYLKASGNHRIKFIYNTKNNEWKADFLVP